MGSRKRATGLGLLTTLCGLAAPAAARADLLDFSVEPMPAGSPTAPRSPVAAKTAPVSLSQSARPTPVEVSKPAVPPSAMPAAAPVTADAVPQPASSSGAVTLNFSPPPVASPVSQASVLASDRQDTSGSDRLLLPVPTSPPVPEPATEATLPPPPEVAMTSTDESSASEPLFAGGPHSLVAKAIGSAEGTRTPTGQRTPAYYGHVDPGNGVWNLGSFSYQHGAGSPEEADMKQLARLQQQAKELKRQAAEQALTLSLAEELNGLDLANQAPLAALDRGYIVWLQQARELHLPETEAVLWARTRSFLDPDTGTWNAPGLGNNVQDISRDQARRQQAIAKAIAAHYPLSSSLTQPEPEPAVGPAKSNPKAARSLTAATESELVDQFLQQDYLIEPGLTSGD